MKIKKIKIKNFKQVEEMKIEFDNLNVLVGNNDSGKTTIIEAINMALTGFYHGKQINNNIEEPLFNSNAVLKYIDSLKSNKPIELPKIIIEVYLDDYPEYNGDTNYERETADGFSFSIEFDEDNYKSSYEKCLKDNALNSLPIEFYRCYWKSFSRMNLISRDIPIKSLIIDSDNYSNTMYYTSRIIKTFFEGPDRINIIQEHRKLNDRFNEVDVLKDVNNRIALNKTLNRKGLKISTITPTQSSWENNMTIEVQKIPFSNIGKGEQNIVKTYLSFQSDSLKNKGLILIEEPECHLSFSNLNKIMNYINTELLDYQVIITTHSSFVANKLGLKNIHLLTKGGKNKKINTLSDDTVDFFTKKAGYDTLRFALCDKSVLVEGDSDELIVQRYYLDKYGKLPIEDGIDVMSVGTSFKRFLELSEDLGIQTTVITDNDGDIKKLQRKYEEYDHLHNVEICYDKQVYEHDEIDRNEVPNINTLEPAILRSNDRTILNKIFDKNYKTDQELLVYMKDNKTECALKIFNHEEKIEYPEYIKEAFNGRNSEK